MGSQANFLFLCGGRRVKLLRLFRAALDAAGGGRILVTDTEPHSAAAFVADATYPVPPCAQEEEFVGAIADICEREQITAVIPLRCVAVKAMPILRDRVAARLITGDDDCIAICSDKVATHDFFTSCGLSTPTVLHNVESEPFPIFYRPRFSEGSRGACAIRTPEQRTALAKTDGVFTCYLDGPEYTIDCYKDLSGRLVTMVPRERLRVRAGEVERAITRYLPTLEQHCRDALARLDFVGPATLQAILTEGGFFFTEINLRYAGGVTLSIAAGMDSPTWLIADLLSSLPATAGPIQWGLGMSRYDEEFYFMQDR